MCWLKGRVDAAAIVDEHLAGSEFIVGDKPTVAAFSMAGYIYCPTDEHGYDWAKSHPNIYGWALRMRGLCGWSDPYEPTRGERIRPRR
jgi:glutathione S-transferase